MMLVREAALSGSEQDGGGAAIPSHSGPQLPDGRLCARPRAEVLKC